MKSSVPLPVAVCFNAKYDMQKLLADYQAAIKAAEWFDKPIRGKYFGWSAIALIAQAGSSGGASVDGHVSAQKAHLSEPTATLEVCPYIRTILDSLSAVKSRARFMRLEVGGVIGLHRDKNYGWEKSIIRLHIPVITNPDVKFFLDGTKLNMKPGELWYLNTTKPHEVRNDGTEDRIHLVIDVVNTKQTRRELEALGRSYEQVGRRRIKQKKKTAKSKRQPKSILSRKKRSTSTNTKRKI